MVIKPHIITSLNGLLPALCSAICLAVALWLAAVSLLCVGGALLLSRRLPLSLVAPRQERLR